MNCTNANQTFTNYIIRKNGLYKYWHKIIGNLREIEIIENLCKKAIFDKKGEGVLAHLTVFYFSSLQSRVKNLINFRSNSF